MYKRNKKSNSTKNMDFLSNIKILMFKLWLNYQMCSQLKMQSNTHYPNLIRSQAPISYSAMEMITPLKFLRSQANLNPICQAWIMSKFWLKLDANCSLQLVFQIQRNQYNNRMLQLLRMHLLKKPLQNLVLPTLMDYQKNQLIRSKDKGIKEDFVSLINASEPTNINNNIKYIFRSYFTSQFRNYCKFRPIRSFQQVKEFPNLSYLFKIQTWDSVSLVMINNKRIQELLCQSNGSKIYIFNINLSTKKSFNPTKCKDAILQVYFIPPQTWQGTPDMNIKHYNQYPKSIQLLVILYAKVDTILDP